LNSNKDLYPENFYRGIDFFNRQFYYECHDIWEELWGNAKGEEKIFYQALIMAAVSLYHFGNDNLKGALSCHQKSVERFSQLPDQFLQFNVSKFVKQMKDFYFGISVEQTHWTQDLRNRHRPTIKLEGKGSS